MQLVAIGYPDGCETYSEDNGNSDSTDTAEDMELDDGDSDPLEKWNWMISQILKTSPNNLWIIILWKNVSL